MPNVQDGLSPGNIDRLKQKAGPASHPKDHSLPTPVKKRKYQPFEDGPSSLDPFTIRVRNHQRFRLLECWHHVAVPARCRNKYFYLPTSIAAPSFKSTTCISRHLCLSWRRSRNKTVFCSDTGSRDPLPRRCGRYSTLCTHRWVKRWTFVRHWTSWAWHICSLQTS